MLRFAAAALLATSLLAFTGALIHYGQWFIAGVFGSIGSAIGVYATIMIWRGLREQR